MESYLSSPFSPPPLFKPTNLRSSLSLTQGDKKLFILIISTLCLLFVSCHAQTSATDTFPGTAITNYDWQSAPINGIFASGGHESGTKFTTTAAGQVTKMIFFAYSGDTTNFVGKIWDTSSTSAPICTTTASPTLITSTTNGGWYSIAFTTPCMITDTTKTYVVSVNYDFLIHINGGLTLPGKLVYFSSTSPVTVGHLTFSCGVCAAQSEGIYPTTEGQFFTSQGLVFVSSLSNLYEK